MATKTDALAEMMTGECLFQRFGAALDDYNRAAYEDKRLEFIDGVLIMHSPANVRHEDQFWFLGTLLRGFCAARGIGRVFGSRTPLHLPDDRRVEPDLLFIRADHLDRLGDVAFEGPADVVIEILSPAARDYDLGLKRRTYAEAGVPEPWIIDADTRRLLVDRPAGARVAEFTQGRFDSTILSGFWLDVDWLWRDPCPDPQTCLREILAK